MAYVKSVLLEYGILCRCVVDDDPEAASFRRALNRLTSIPLSMLREIDPCRDPLELIDIAERYGGAVRIDSDPRAQDTGREEP